MRKTIRFAIAGCPVVAIPVQKWRERQTFKVAGKKPVAGKDKRFEAFVPGATNWLRKRIADSLRESPELLKRDVVVEVTDLGEAMLEPEHDFQGAYGLPEDEMAGLAREFAESAKGFDCVMLVGGDHTAGLVLYGLPGRVARFDEHSDACAVPLKCGNDEVTRNNFVCCAIRNRLKAEGDIVGIGVREGEASYQIVENVGPQGCDVLDVDIDVFAEKHGFVSDYGKGRLSPDDVVGAIRKARPAALGLFEVIDGDERAAEFAEQLAEELALAASRPRA